MLNAKFILSITLCVSILSSHSALAENPSWSKAEAQIADLQDQLKYNQSVQKIAYSFTKDLCYIYEFRAAHGLTPINPNDLYDEYYMWRDMRSDPKMQAAAWASWVISGYAVKSLLTDGQSEYLILSRSRFTNALTHSMGYIDAARECSIKAGVPILEDMTAQIRNIEWLSSGAVGIIGGGLALKLLVRLARLGLVSGTMKWVSRSWLGAPKWVRYATAFGGASAVGTVALAAIVDYQSRQAFFKAVQNNPSRLNSAAAQIDLWAAKRERLRSFNLQYSEWAENLAKNEQNIDSATMTRADIPVQLIKDAEFFNQYEDIFQQKFVELQSQIGQAEIDQLVAKTTAGQPLTAAEEPRYELLIFLEQLRTALDFVKLAKAHQLLPPKN